MIDKTLNPLMFPFRFTIIQDKHRDWYRLENLYLHSQKIRHFILISQNLPKSLLM